MESLDYWRLCDELNIIQAALLVVDCDPGAEEWYVEEWPVHKRPPGYEAAKTAITNALRRGSIGGQLTPRYEHDINGIRCAEIEGSIDLVESRVNVESLRRWLVFRGIRPAFFFPATTGAPDYLDPENPRYAHKLAASVQAWRAVTDPGGKHPKQALTKWLREHAAEYGLTDDDGKINETGVDEVAKVANWKPGGGAPKTPGE